MMRSRLRRKRSLAWVRALTKQPKWLTTKHSCIVAAEGPDQDGENKYNSSSPYDSLSQEQKEHLKQHLVQSFQKDTLVNSLLDLDAETLEHFRKENDSEDFTLESFLASKTLEAQTINEKIEKNNSNEATKEPSVETNETSKQTMSRSRVGFWIVLTVGAWVYANFVAKWQAKAGEDIYSNPHMQAKTYHVAPPVSPVRTSQWRPTATRISSPGYVSEYETRTQQVKAEARQSSVEQAITRTIEPTSVSRGLSQALEPKASIAMRAASPSTSASAGKTTPARDRDRPTTTVAEKSEQQVTGNVMKLTAEALQVPFVPTNVRAEIWAQNPASATTSNPVDQGEPVAEGFQARTTVRSQQSSARRASSMQTHMRPAGPFEPAQPFAHPVAIKQTETPRGSQVQTMAALPRSVRHSPTAISREASLSRSSRNVSAERHVQAQETRSVQAEATARGAHSGGDGSRSEMLTDAFYDLDAIEQSFSPKNRVKLVKRLDAMASPTYTGENYVEKSGYQASEAWKFEATHFGPWFAYHAAEPGQLPSRVEAVRGNGPKQRQTYRDATEVFRSATMEFQWQNGATRQRDYLVFREAMLYNVKLLLNSQAARNSLNVLLYKFIDAYAQQLIQKNKTSAQSPVVVHQLCSMLAKSETKPVFPVTSPEFNTYIEYAVETNRPVENVMVEWGKAVFILAVVMQWRFQMENAQTNPKTLKKDPINPKGLRTLARGYMELIQDEKFYSRLYDLAARPETCLGVLTYDQVQAIMRKQFGSRIFREGRKLKKFKRRLNKIFKKDADLNVD